MLEQNLTIPVEVSRTKTKCFIYFSTWLPHGNKMDTLLVQYQFSVSKTPVWTQNHINTRKVFPKIVLLPPPPLPEPSLIWSIKPYSDICKILIVNTKWVMNLEGKWQTEHENVETWLGNVPSMERGCTPLKRMSDSTYFLFGWWVL